MNEDDTSPRFTDRNKKSSESKLIIIVFVILIGTSFLLYTFLRQSTRKDQDIENEDEIVQQEVIEEDNDAEELEEEDGPVVQDRTADEDTDDEEESDEEPTNNNVTVSGDIEAVEGENVVPGGWKVVPNETYNYTAYRPSSWYYRFYGAASTLGIDPADLPEGGEYAGLVNITVVNGDLQTVIDERTSNYLGIAESNVTEDNGTWKIIEATAPESPVSSEKMVITAFTIFDDQVVIVDTRAEAGLYENAKLVFNDFYKSVLFGEVLE